ncbi:SDR family oxidoreductase [Parvibaculum sp.]|jgi:NAD(P)-dependent dehydrogenase (short-subunit alcohol dehydrogenase family)|uniref:SDR family oxidoreductase n=1 Tax=Parvibaculum sp. TaxID=2024848 RepID=UPI0025E31442|nr:SDR family oxidoreductase [Parvibaculum sp.]|tara:strand:+ start:36948 stop:37400 length:453 start_codon:yes stop_codon:yes gene_type:complete
MTPAPFARLVILLSDVSRSRRPAKGREPVVRRCPVFLSSAAPLNGIPNYSIYAAARGAANSLALTLAKELASHNIQVNALGFNFIESPDYFPASLLDDPKSRDKILGNIPLRHLGKPEEAAAIVAFLAGPGSDFITGQLIPVAGGWATVR